MKGDFTRFSFDPTKHYSGVLMQQGRVQLDADWNEQIGTQTRYAQLVTGDLVGLTGAPQAGGGFQVTISSDGKQILLSQGRMYVGGALCELNAATSYDHQPDYPGAVYPTPTNLDPAIAGASPLPGVAAPGKDANGNWIFLAYLDTWARHVTAVEDPNVAEIALGGPDTGTRVQTLAQVKLAGLSSDVTPVPAGDWSAVIAPSQALLAAAAYVPDTVGALSLSPGYVTLPSFLQPPPQGSPTPATPPVDFSAGFAFEAWVFLPALPAGIPLLYLSDGTPPNTIEIATGSTAGVLMFTVGTGLWTAPGAIDAGTWTHVAVSIDKGGNVQMYKNGTALFVTGAGSLPPNANRTSCFLGHAATGTSTPFSGSLAEVRVWATALAAPTVASRINANAAHLAAYYPLNAGSTSVVKDSSPAGRDGTAQGTFAWSTNGPALAVAGTTTAQYIGPENQLYRVEIHSVNAAGAVTFKWSRDNGSIASAATLGTPTTGPSPTQTLKLTAPARDDVLGWAVGQWIEITTTSGDLQGVTGTLAQIAAIQGNALTISAITSSIPAPGPVTVRRWDGYLPNAFTPPATATATPWQSAWIPLENGISVQFSGRAPFKPGDYWVMPARTATQAIEWPLAPNTQPAARCPLGIQHSYAQLAKVYLTPGGSWVASTLPELRQTFPPMVKAVVSTGVLSWDNTSVLVNGTLNVGSSTQAETSNFWGPINAKDGINVSGAPLTITGQPINAPSGLNVNVSGAPLTVAGQPINATDGINVSGAPLAVTGQPINAGGMVNANAGLTVTGAPANIGSSGSPQPLSVWADTEGQSAPVTAVTIHGPNNPTNANSAQDLRWSFASAGSSLIRAYRGGSWDTYLEFYTNAGGQGSDQPQRRMHIDQDGSVTMYGAVNASGLLTATAGITAGAINCTSATASSFMRIPDQPLYLRGVDNQHGVVYGGAATGTTPFTGSSDVDGPVVFGYNGGGLGSSTSGTKKYALKWDSNQNVNAVGPLNATDGLTVTGSSFNVGTAAANQASFLNGTLTVTGRVVLTTTSALTVDNTFDIFQPNTATYAMRIHNPLNGGYLYLQWDPANNLDFYRETGAGQFLDVNGNWNHNSDASLKENVLALDGILDRVTELRPVSFDWKATSQKGMGFVAQDVEQIFPDLVAETVRPDGERIKALPYATFGVLAIAALKEMKTRYDERIRDLEEKLAELTARARGT